MLGESNLGHLLQNANIMNSVRTCIREYHPDFRVTAYSWPRFLYEDYAYNPNSPSQGLFKSDLLVKVCLGFYFPAVLNHKVLPGIQTYFHLSGFSASP